MGWNWFLVVDHILLSCVIVIHIVALILLRRSKHSNKYKNQIIIITALCVCELTGATLLIGFSIFYYFVSSLVADIILCFKLIFILMNYYFVMVLLTLDRFLVFYLNFRYQSHVSPSKTYKMISFVALICLIISITFAVLISAKTIILSQLYVALYIMYLLFDVGYIGLTIGTYFYIFKVFRRQLKFKKTSQVARKKDQFNLTVPTSIIGSFIIFNIIPNILIASHQDDFESLDSPVVQVAFIFYRIGWLIHPVIYIFFSSCSKDTKEVKGKVKSKNMLDSDKVERDQDNSGIEESNHNFV